METARIDRTKKWTVDDYQMLEQMNTPCQFINGELIMSPSPTPLHQRVLKKLFKLFDAHSAGGEVFFAPLDLFIDKRNVFQPDLIYISDVNKSIISRRGIEGPPDIAVEIISASNVFSDRNTKKKKKYSAFGVRECWIVDPANQTLEIYLPDQADPEVPHLYLAGEGKVTSTVITSLEFDLKVIF